jgi:hypothetical protein
MTYSYLVKYIANGEEGKAMISLHKQNLGIFLLVYEDHSEVKEFSDSHLFVSFCNLRLSLEMENKMLLCKGARIDVHPSGMQLVWIYANKLVLGKRIDPKNDKVMIFDEEPDRTVIGSVLAQEMFYKQWLDSIKQVEY